MGLVGAARDTDPALRTDEIFPIAGLRSPGNPTLPDRRIGTPPQNQG
ncbi:MAG: hypothetical protein ABIQ51_03240 [Mesorhizobium sp.]